MAKRNYERLPIETFGRHLLTTGDLDPIYLALYNSSFDKHERARWLIAYWCFYHAGVACWMSQRSGKEFWGEMMKAAVNDEAAPTGGRWPRGHERRHFRGGQAVRSVKFLSDRYADPEEMVEYVAGWPTKETNSHLPFETVNERVQQHIGFGPWIAFKVGDMLDRLGLRPVDFTEAHVFMFKDPAKAAHMLWTTKMGLPPEARPRDQHAMVHQIVEHLKQEFSDFQAPPIYDRPVDLQEVETILCKWKSHMNGHYPLNNDIDEITEGLADWTHEPAAYHFLECMDEIEEIE